MINHTMYTGWLKIKAALRKGLFVFLFSFGMISFAAPVSLVIGTSPDNPPFSSFTGQNNNFFGFEIDIMLEICQRIQAQCSFVPTVVGQITNSINSGKIDLAIAAIIIPTPGSNPGYIFSLPYLQSYGQYISKTQSNFNSFEDMTNKKLGVRQGTLYGGSMFKDFALNMFNNQINITLYPSMGDLLDALLNSEVDAVFSNAEPVRYWSINNTKFFKLIGNKIPIGNGYGIMAKVGQDQIIASINQAIMQMEKDGTYLKIYSRYFSL